MFRPPQPGDRPSCPASSPRSRAFPPPQQLVPPSPELESPHRPMDAKQVWRAALGELQVTLSPANFETWLRDTALVEVDDTRFRISVPNGFANDWLESRYRSLISQTLGRIVGYGVQVDFVVGPAEGSSDDAAPDAEPVSAGGGERVGATQGADPSIPGATPTRAPGPHPPPTMHCPQL